MPAHNDVAAAVVVASVSMTHTIAPPTPALSARRCKYALDWVYSTYGCHFFHHPVDWRTLGLMDYLDKIPYPMDLETLKAYTVSAHFCFATMLDRSRIIWANACLYNGEGHPVAAVARRIAALFEAKIIELQQHPIDDDAAALANVMMPVLHALMAEDMADSFLQPVDLQLNPSYPTVVDHGICLEDVKSCLENCMYANRHDFAADVRRVFDNAVQFNSQPSMLCVRAKNLRHLFDRIFAACVNDVDGRVMLTCDMRMGLHDNLYRLSEANRLRVMQRMRDDKCVSIRDSAGETSISVDMMCTNEFFRIDMFVRQFLVHQKDAEHSDSAGEVESDGDDTC